MPVAVPERGHQLFQQLVASHGRVGGISFLGVWVVGSKGYAAILATRSDIELFLVHGDGRLSSGWRHDVVGGDSPSSGVMINFVPRDGGNTCSYG